MAERTHDPTPKRVREARDKGDVPYAPLVAAALGLLVLPPLGRAALGRWVGLLQHGLGGGALEPWVIARAALGLAVPCVATLAAIGVVSAIAQGSVTFSTQRLAVDPTRLDPVGGLGRLLDRQRAYGAARGVVALLVLVAALYPLVRGALVAAARGGDALTLVATSASRVVVVGGGCLAVLAVLDVLVARQLWLGRHRMTREEVTREHRESDGDPEIKRRREELHHELIAAEAVAAVRTATVVVVNPTHLACALRYAGASDEEAPVLVAKGHGALAARIVAAAKAHGVPVVQDVPVARALIALEIGVEIPEALYEAVAEVLAMAAGEDA